MAILLFSGIILYCHIFHSLEAPSITAYLTSVTPTTIPLMWTSAGSVVNSYEVEWRYDGECSNVRGGSATFGGAMTSYTMERLEEYTIYSITVTAVNDIGRAVSEVATARTTAAGKIISPHVFISLISAESCGPPIQSVPLAHPSPLLLLSMGNNVIYNVTGDQ